MFKSLNIFLKRDPQRRNKDKKKVIRYFKNILSTYSGATENTH